MLNEFKSYAFVPKTSRPPNAVKVYIMAESKCMQFDVPNLMLRKLKEQVHNMAIEQQTVNDFC